MEILVFKDHLWWGKENWQGFLKTIVPGFCGGSMVKILPAYAEDLGSVHNPGSSCMLGSN